MDQSTQTQVARDWTAAPWLLAAREPTVLGSAFDWAWPVEEALPFDDLLRAIDEADRSAEP